MATEGKWQLPYLAEKRNVYWDAQTVRLVNGESMPADSETWLPVSLPVKGQGQPAAHRFDFSNGMSVIARPLSTADLPQLLPNAKIAVVVDRSRSMSGVASQVDAALARLKQLTGAGNSVTVYLTSSSYRGQASMYKNASEVIPSDLSYVGGQNPAELLEEFVQLRGDNSYDAVLILTDGIGYELGASSYKPPTLEMPLWFVHVGGNFPLGYDDTLLEAMQASGGGAAGSVDEALARLAVYLALKRGEPFANVPAGATADWADGYLWLTLPTSDAPKSVGGALTSEEQFAPFAARRMVLTDVQRKRALLQQLTTLDQLHAMAAQWSVVTPYSSMIVLVNDQQRQLLKQLEQRGDRFDREVEEVGDTTAQNPFTVTGVPEPQEWLLIAIGAVLVVWYWRVSQRMRKRISG